MKLTANELAYVRSQGLYITERCAGCGKLLNQTVRYTITGKLEVYCSAACRNLEFFDDRHEARKQATRGKCAYCGGGLSARKRGTLYCDDACRMRHSRVRERPRTQQVEKPRTPAQSNQ
jgi:phage FluMu protein Com